MGYLHLIRKNLGRKKIRTFFTAMSIFIAFLLFGLLGALNQAFSIGVDMAGADRLITVHKVSLIQLLPISYERRIEALDGVSDVVHFTWFGAYYQDPKVQFFGAPTEPESLFDVYPEFTLPESEKQAWFANRTGAIVGELMAETYGWKVGDRVPIGSTIWPQQDGSRTWEFTIEGIFDDGGEGANEQALYFHYDYFDEARQFGAGLVGWYIVQISDTDRTEDIAKAIDAQFANSPTETKTTTEKGWVQGFANQIGNIGLIVSAIVAAVFFTMLLVSGNTMAQSVRERTNELAVLKTVGFSDAQVLRMVLSESLLLSTVAGGLGLFMSVGMADGMQKALAQFLPGFAITAETLGWGAVMIVVLGLVAGAPPALKAMRLNVATALARR